jgi:hypothetical protein
MTYFDWAKDKVTEFWSRLEFTHLKPITKYTDPTLTEMLTEIVAQHSFLILTLQKTSSTVQIGTAETKC